MSRSIKISRDAFNGSIPTALTNEIPHVPTYSILNQHLRNTWSHELIGKTYANYDGNLNSVKMMNGEQSESYFPRYVKFANPKDNKIYEIDVGKIDFSVDGAWETEMDYLMHEMARYLSKLYPDDYLSAITLTEAERQSYFNEALHMIHSYFDTEQISVDDELDDIYYRNRFATGITAIRKNTGTTIQEQQLTGLINTGNLTTFSGYKNFISSNGEVVSSKIEDIDTYNSDIYPIYTVFAEDRLSSFNAERVFGKIREDSLQDFYENASTVEQITAEVLTTNFKHFYKTDLKEAEELLVQLIDSEQNSVVAVNFNKLILQATEQGEMRSGSSFVALKNGTFKDTVVVPAATTPYSLVFPKKKATSVNILNNESLAYEDVQNFENCFIVNAATVATLDKSYLVKTGYTEYTEDFLLAIGNWIVSQISVAVSSSDTFTKNLQFVLGASSDSLNLMVEIYQQDELVFAGLLNRDYYSNLESPVLGDHFYIQDWQSEYSAENICSYILDKKLVKVPLLDSEKEFKFVFRTVRTNRDDLLARSAYVYQDSVNYRDPVVISIMYSAATNSYDVELQMPVKITSQTTGEVVDTSLSYIDYYTGSTKLGEIVSGSKKLGCKYSEESNSFLINGFTYKLSEDGIIYTTTDESVELSQKVSFIESNLKYFRPDLLNLVAMQGRLAVNGVILDASFNATCVRSFNNLLLTEVSSTIATKAVQIEYYVSLQDVLQNNFTVAVENAISSTGSMLYTSRLVKNANFEVPVDTILTQVALAEILFESKSTGSYELYTAKCSFYADNIIRIQKDIVTEVSKLARVNSLILDNYGNLHPCKVVKAIVKNDYCYLTLLESVSGLSALANTDGFIILDLQKKLKADTNTETEALARKPASKTLYKANNQYYFLGMSWKELSRSNLDYYLTNVGSSDAVAAYNNAANICKYTTVPTVLSELEDLTIVDLQDQRMIDLVEDLITENKSLYLDSSIRSLIHIPMSLHNTVNAEDYGVYTYLYSDVPPSYISFYNSKNYLSYEPLTDFLESKKKALEIEDVEKSYNRRHVVWGSVVWDANNVNKSIKTLRTIWGGYFTNFEFYSTSDVIPSEADLNSLDSENVTDSTNVNILNYNYSANSGTPETQWNIVTEFSKSSQGSIGAQVIDAFTHSTFSEADSEKTQILDYASTAVKLLYLDSFSFEANRLNLKSNYLNLANCTSQIEAVDVGKLKLSVQNVNDVTVAYDYEKKTFVFTLKTNTVKGNYALGSKYKLRLVYNMLHDKTENYRSLNFLKTDKLDTATQMILEYFLFQYMTSQIIGYKSVIDSVNDTTVFTVLENNSITFTNEKKLLDYIASIYNGDAVIEEEAWSNYNSLNNQTRNNVRLTDVLEYAANCTDYIPTIGVINSEGTVELYYARFVKNDENDFTIYTGSVAEPASGDLLDCLMPIFYKNFQTKASLYTKDLALLTKQQYLLPDRVSGKFSDLDILLDPESYYIPEDDYLGFSETQIRQERQSYQKEDGLLMNIFDSRKNLTTSESSLTFNNDLSFNLFSSSRLFRECYPATLAFSTTENETDSADILRCQIHFNKDFQLTNDGYLYLTQLRIPNIRSSYNEKRETQVVERDYLLENLHILAFQESDGYAKFVLQDSSMSQSRRITGIIDKIKPVDESEYSQQIVDTQLNFGFAWTNPGVKIGYTFYKRKFVAEGVIDGVLPTTVRLADQDLEDDDDFDLTNHIAPGDSVQLWILNPTSNYVDGGVAVIPIDVSADKGYVGPYKVIYVSRNSSKAEPTQSIILSGPGNLVYVEVEIQTGALSISDPYIFDSTNSYYAFATSNGEIAYRDDNDTSYIIQLRSGVQITVDNFVDKLSELLKEGNSESVEALITASTVEPTLSEALLATLKSTHTEWEAFDRTSSEADEDYEGEDAEDLVNKDLDAYADDEDNLHGESETTIEGAPTEVVETISLTNGSINYDAYDRVYFQPSEGNENGDVEWLANPAQAEDFDASGHYEAIEISDTLVSIDDADDSVLIDFIREAVIGIFDQTSAAALIGSGQVAEKGEADTEADLPDNPEKKFSLSADTHLEAAQVAIGRTIFNATGDGEVDLTLNGIYLPTFTECDVPVYLKEGEEPKWKKVKVITGTTGRRIDQATSDELKEFAHAINPTDYITRRSPKVTSWIKSGKYIVAWDQTTGTVTVMDKKGNLKGRVAIPTVGYRQPATAQNLSGEKQAKAWSVNNRLFAATAATSAGFAEYVAQANARNQVETVYRGKGTVTEGIYSIFEKVGTTEGTLYLPTLFAELKTKTDAEIKEVLKSGNADYFDVSGVDCSVAQDKGVALIRFALDTNQYNAYRNYCKWLDYFAPDSCEYISFKDTSHTCNVALLREVLIALKSSSNSRYGAAVSALNAAEAKLQAAKNKVDTTRNTWNKAKQTLSETEAAYQTASSAHTVASRSLATAEIALETATTNLANSKSTYAAYYTDYETVKAVKDTKGKTGENAALKALYGQDYLDDKSKAANEGVDFVSKLCTSYDENTSKYATYTETTPYVRAFVEGNHTYVVADVAYRQSVLDLRKADARLDTATKDLATKKAEESKISSEYEERAKEAYFKGKVLFLYGSEKSSGEYNSDSFWATLTLVKNSYSSAINYIKTYMTAASDAKKTYRDAAIKFCEDFENNTEAFEAFEVNLQSLLTSNAASAENNIYSKVENLYKYRNSSSYGWDQTQTYVEDEDGDEVRSENYEKLVSALKKLYDLLKSTGSNSRGTITAEKTSAMNALTSAMAAENSGLKDTTAESELNNWMSTFEKNDYAKYVKVKSDINQQYSAAKAVYTSTETDDEGLPKGLLAKATRLRELAEAELTAAQDLVNDCKSAKNTALGNFNTAAAREQLLANDVENKKTAYNSAKNSFDYYTKLLEHHTTGYEIITSYTCESTDKHIFETQYIDENGVAVDFTHIVQVKPAIYKKAEVPATYRAKSVQTYSELDNVADYYYDKGNGIKERVRTLAWESVPAHYTLTTVNGTYTLTEQPVLYEYVATHDEYSKIESSNYDENESIVGYYFYFDDDYTSVQETYEAALAAYSAAQTDLLTDDGNERHDTAREAYDRAVVQLAVANKNVEDAKAAIEILERLGKSVYIQGLDTDVESSAYTLDSLIEQVHDTLVPQPVKGLPYFTESVLEQDSVFKQYKSSSPIRMTSISTTGSTTYAFESLVKTSGFEIANGKAFIYGDIEWPDLDALKTKVRTTFNAAMQSSKHVSDTYRSSIADAFANAIEQEILANFTAFCGEVTEDNPYKANAVKPFTVTVDLETLQIVNIVSKENESGLTPTILTMKANGESITTITDSGEMSVSADQSIIQDNEMTVTKGIAGGVVLVYDALKNLDTFGDLTFDASNLSLSVQLVGTSIANPEIAYSTVKSVSAKTFELRDDVVLLDESETVNAILLVKSTQKDNFQFAYGDVTNLEYIPAAKTLFEVSNYHYADFASYDNKDSVGGWSTTELEGDEAQIWAKPSVFDLYPKFEQIDEEYRKYFYKTNSDGSAQYLKNDNGRYIYRICSTYGEYVGGQFVRNDNSAVAGNTGNIEATLIRDASCYQRSYDYVNKNLGVQRIPSLVTNPNAAIQDYPYRSVKLDLTQSDRSRLQIFDDYLIATVQTSGLKSTLESVYKETSRKYYLTANKTQLATILQNVTDFETASTEYLANHEPTKNYFDANRDLIAGNYISYQGVQVDELTDENTVVLKASNATTISNENYAVTATTSYTGDLAGEWIVLKDNLSISSLKTYIDNRTETLPRFVPITKYKSKRNSIGELVLLGTTSKELYIPSKGYGQALLGDYTLPRDCPFEKGTFYSSDSAEFTRNNSNEKFYLVDQYGNRYVDDQGKEVQVPNLVYKSFASADAALSKKLPTVNVVENVNESVLIDLSYFSEVDVQNIYFENSEGLLNLGLITGNISAADDEDEAKKELVYELFKNNLEVACNLSYSKYGLDTDTNNTIEISEELKSTLGYTRASVSFAALPVNYRYKLADGTYKTVLTGSARDTDHYLADEEGKLYYADTNGKLTTTATGNPPVPAPRSSENIRFFELQSGRIESILNNCFGLAAKVIKGNYSLHTIGSVDSTQMKSIVAYTDPNQSATSYEYIRREKHINMQDWSDTVHFNWNFRSLNLKLSYTESTKKYNFCYLKDKEGNIVGKVFFETPVSAKNQLIFSLIE